ncbi:hypothetical protein [Prevotella sp.]|nr:hypothetical protein [Prevotella sp.]
MKAFYKFLFALVAFVAISVNASAANNSANPFMNKEIVAVTEMTSPVPDTIIERQVVMERTIIYEFEGWLYSGCASKIYNNRKNCYTRLIL